MSYTEPSADGVQPEQGQGDGGATGDQPYGDLLSRVPEEVRGSVEPLFAEWNSRVNSRFEDAASYRKQWEPYESIGLSDMQPDQVQWALQVANAAQNDPQALRTWLDDNHPQPAPQQQPEPQQDVTFDQYDPNAQFKQMLDPVLQRLEAMDQRWQQQQQQEYERTIDNTLNSEIAKLSQEHGASLPQGVEMSDVIERFGNRYATPGADPAQVVQKAWQDYTTWSNALSTAALQQKVDQPQTPVTGGEADMTPEPFTRGNALGEANKIATQQIRETLRANGGFSIG